MRIVTQMAVAYGADLLCGDPRWFPHPVKFIGRTALALEAPLRRHIANARLAGIVAVAIVVGGTTVLTVTALSVAYRVHPWAGDAVSILLLYTTFATRDLAAHAMAVYRALKRHDLGAARELVSRIVGRDTEALDEAGVVRAAVESVAENTVDGVTAPLFFAALGGLCSRWRTRPQARSIRHSDTRMSAISISAGPPRGSTISPRGCRHA